MKEKLSGYLHKFRVPLQYLWNSQVKLLRKDWLITEAPTDQAAPFDLSGDCMCYQFITSQVSSVALLVLDSRERDCICPGGSQCRILSAWAHATNGTVTLCLECLGLYALKRWFGVLLVCTAGGRSFCSGASILFWHLFLKKSSVALCNPLRLYWWWKSCPLPTPPFFFFTQNISNSSPWVWWLSDNARFYW